jgi:calcium/calmodulin-dependent protein kinase I
MVRPVSSAGYTLGDALGEGAFAVTRIGFSNAKPDQPVAVKTVLRRHPRFNLDDLRAEIAIMEKINHPRCVNLIEVHEDNEAIHLVEELGAGGELFDRIIELGSFSEKDACHLIHQVVDGVTYLHSQGCIHRDLKPENLLMVGRDPNTDEYMQVKICDFGLSAMRTISASDAEFNENLQKFNGTEEYLAPEVFITAASHKNGEHYTGKIDVWAIGVIYYIMLSGRFPFMRDDDDPMALAKQICEGRYDMACLSSISEDVTCANVNLVNPVGWTAARAALTLYRSKVPVHGRCIVKCMSSLFVNWVPAAGSPRYSLRA